MAIDKSKYYTGKSLPLRQAFGIAVKEARESKNLAQIELGVAIDRAQSFISEVECGTRNITLEIIYELCDELDIKVSTMFSRAETIAKKK